MKDATVLHVTRLNQVFRLGAFLIVFVVLNNPANAQDYLQSTGFPSFSVVQRVALGGIDISNGNLHLEIPVGIYSQRGGHVIQQRFTYDSRIWKISVNGASQSWAVDNTSGWQGQAGFASASVNFNVQSVPCGTSSYNLYNAYTWTDEHQTAHFFPISIPTNIPSGCNAPPPVLTAYSTDSSGFFMSANASAPTTPNVYYPDGTIFIPPSSSDAFAHTKDPNGNQVNYEPGSTSQLVDTLGRQFTYTFSSANPAFSEPNSQGGTSSYQATGETISVSTAFGQSGVSEFSGNITVFRSISLPDGSTYQFQYDSYGELSGITLPTGGSVTFGYTNFVDAYGNVNRWASSYTMSGGTWTYSPQVISTCPSGQRGCQQKVTVTNRATTLRYTPLP
jgi:YD repeat-containing protein